MPSRSLLFRERGNPHGLAVGNGTKIIRFVFDWLRTRTRVQTQALGQSKATSFVINLLGGALPTVSKKIALRSLRLKVDVMKPFITGPP